MKYQVKIIIVAAAIAAAILVNCCGAFADYGFSPSEKSDYGCSPSQKTDYGFIEASDHKDYTSIKAVGSPSGGFYYYNGYYYNNGYYYDSNLYYQYYYPNYDRSPVLYPRNHSSQKAQPSSVLSPDYKPATIFDSTPKTVFDKN